MLLATVARVCLLAWMSLGGAGSCNKLSHCTAVVSTARIAGVAAPVISFVSTVHFTITIIITPKIAFSREPYFTRLRYHFGKDNDDNDNGYDMRL